MHRNILSESQLHARGTNAVAALLERHLIVPKIFFDAAWPVKTSRVDVLAVDRAGSGDIHVVEVTVGKQHPGETISRVMQLPAHFKYVALIANGNYLPTLKSLYAPDDGPGRIGVIQIVEVGDELKAEFRYRPERFRVDPTVIKQIDRFTARHQADIELRA